MEGRPFTRLLSPSLRASAWGARWALRGHLPPWVPLPGAPTLPAHALWACVLGEALPSLPSSSALLRGTSLQPRKESDAHSGFSFIPPIRSRNTRDHGSSHSLFLASTVSGLEVLPVHDQPLPGAEAGSRANRITVGDGSPCVCRARPLAPLV